jgi:AcrR family transcriptional regulator
MKSQSVNFKKQETHSRILDVAARLFIEKGFNGTSVRDIAATLGISNPSIYYHFESKGEIFTELMAEPLERLQNAILDAEQFSGAERTQRIIGGILDSLEIHSGIAVTAFRDINQIPDTYRDLALAMRPHIEDVIGEGVAEDNRHLRIIMAFAAVEVAVSEFMLTSKDGNNFVEKLRANRNIVIELVLRILR